VNMALGGNEELKRMMELGLFDALVELLGETDASVLKIVLEGVKRFLSYGDRNENNEEGNKVAERLKELGGVEKLESLQEHQDKHVYKLALRQHL